VRAAAGVVWVVVVAPAVGGVEGHAAGHGARVAAAAWGGRGAAAGAGAAAGGRNGPLPLCRWPAGCMPLQADALCCCAAAQRICLHLRVLFSHQH